MSDASVHNALRSGALLVAVEAPGGCGKTYQGASYARDVADSIHPGRLLILTHTHAACSVFHSRTLGLGSNVEIRTIDSLVSELTDAYHPGLGLPPDTADWARREKNGYDKLAVKAAALIKRFPAIAATMSRRYPVVICDEHQDSTSHRHAIVMALHGHGSRLRLFADPMQQVFEQKTAVDGYPPLDWTGLTATADAFEELDFPHRWKDGCPMLGAWILKARNSLKDGGTLDLQTGLPPSVVLVRAENEAKKILEYRPERKQRAPIDQFEKTSASLLILSRYGDATQSVRATFSRRIPLWEGNVRPALERYVDALTAANEDRNAVATAITVFVQATATGFTGTDHVKTFLEDVADGCARKRSGGRAAVQQLARLIVDEPNHVGAAKVLAQIAKDSAFSAVQLDCRREYHEAARLARYECPQSGFREIARLRTYTRPQPPPRAISTIHKAKGLECKNVIVMPCDAKSFPDKPLARCLLYVAISRASHRLMLVIPQSNPSPLLSLT
jgi:DNA helicase-2/ATP-dependent DNA helicase PcrA